MTVLSIFLQAATGSGMSSILMMVALIAIFYLSSTYKCNFLGADNKQ